MKTRQLTTEEKGLIVGMHEAKMSGADIARNMGMPKTTVYTILKNFQLRGTVVSPKPTGRPQKLTPRDKREIVKLLSKNRSMSLAQITREMTVKVSYNTVRKAIRSLGYNNRIAAKKPFLSVGHKITRLQFAREHVHWSASDWKYVIWTDESTFEIGKRSRQVKVWRRSYERYSWDCLAPTFKSGRTSVMVWGAFTGFDICPLVIMDIDKRTANDFVEVVYESRLSGFYFMHKDRSRLILMEDGAPVHRSKLPRLWREAHGISKLDWPPNSPDLNPIENLWKIVKDSVQKEALPKNREELIETIQRAWEGVSEEILGTLISSMPCRLKAVIKAQGGHTRW